MSKPTPNEFAANLLNNRILKSFDSVGSGNKSSTHKRYKSSGSSNVSSKSNESKFIPAEGNQLNIYKNREKQRSFNYLHYS